MERTRRHAERGAALLIALVLLFALAVVTAGILQVTGTDRIRAARLGVRERAQACAEAGIQYGRRFFGQRYDASAQWNAYLDKTVQGYRYDPALDAAPSDLTALPTQVRGASDGATLDPGADLDGDGQPDFWVSIRDDEDEVPLGAVENRLRDNNEVVWLRSECTNPAWRLGPTRDAVVVVEVLLAHVQGSSGYGNAQITSNSPDVSGGAQ